MFISNFLTPLRILTLKSIHKAISYYPQCITIQIPASRHNGTSAFFAPQYTRIIRVIAARVLFKQTFLRARLSIRPFPRCTFSPRAPACTYIHTSSSWPLSLPLSRLRIRLPARSRVTLYEGCSIKRKRERKTQMRTFCHIFRERLCSRDYCALWAGT